MTLLEATEEVEISPLEETEISVYDLPANLVLDILIENCGEVAVLDYVQRKAWRPVSTEDRPLWRDGTVLLTVAPRSGQTWPYVIVGAFDDYRGYWRTQMGPLDDWLEVLGWQQLPEAMKKTPS